jgi:hypothetical protein
MSNGGANKYLAKSIGNALRKMSKKHKKVESIFNDSALKVKEFKLPGDAASMTYLACLKEEFSGLNLDQL